MKIGIVLPESPGYSETFFTSKIKGLESSGYEVVLFVNSIEDKTLLTSKIKVAPSFSGNFIKVVYICSLCLLKSVLFHFSASKRLFLLDKKDKLSFVKRIKNIIINSHILSEKLDWLHFGFGTMVFDRENVSQSIGAKMAVSFRGFDIGIYPIKNPKCYDKVWAKIDKIHVISDDIKDLLVKNGLKNCDKIVKICPAINTDFFTLGVNAKNEVYEILTIARLNWKKGLEYALESLVIVKQHGFKFHYTIIGDGKEKERLQFAVYQLGLVENVTFTGKLSPQEVKNKLQQADLYLQYSVQEGFCNAVIEAQAMGKICIVSDAEGLSENVIDTVTGFVVPKRNSLFLANKIIAVMALPDLEKNTISKAAISRVNDKFNIENQINSFIAFYKKH